MLPKEYLQRAIELSIESVKNGGGPFGAVIVKDGKIIAESNNTVTIDNDPTAHAEINAIRKACKELNSFDLSNCEIYTSCEPCPMCLGAIYWARISKIYYANSQNDAAKNGFDDSFIYDELNKPINKRTIPTENIKINNSTDAFKAWKINENKTLY